MNRLLIGLVGLASACATAVVELPPIGHSDPAEYHPFAAEGDPELKGQAFLTTRGGDVKLAAGRLVTLDPATDYTMKWFRRAGATVSRFEEVPPDSVFSAHRRTAIANAEGRFQFSELPAGEYLLRTMVTWETGSTQEGGVVATVVSVPGEGGAEVILRDHYSQSEAAALGIVILESQDPPISYRVIDEVRGRSCQVGPFDPAPDEAAARSEMLVEAGRRGADAISNVRCESRGISLIPNCTSRIDCRGEAITSGGR